MKSILRLEELMMFLLCAWFLYFFGAAWYWYLLMLIGPDISMLGYLAGNKVGAVLYNLFHHKGIAIALIIAGIRLNNMMLTFTGIILFGHSSLDRFAGYGLKYFEGFKFTHLGKIGNKG
ncbi:MAG: DUF4260 domain-containing protein [Ferruginibacter sp.]